MSYLRLSILALCLAAPTVARAADGSVSLYLQPLPGDAAKLTFAIASMSATSAGGSEHALDLKLRVVGQATASRQRLLASGRLPTGSYTGFVFRVKQAVLKSDQGDVTLPVPDVPVTLNFPFTVTTQQGSLFWLTLRYDQSISSGFSFSPVFAAVAPPGQVSGHAGFVTNFGSNTVTVLDKRLWQAVALIDTCGGPTGLALDQRRGQIYVVCSRDDEIESIDVTAAKVVGRSRLSPGDDPREVALTPDGRTLVSVNTGSNSITLFDAAPLTQLERIAVGEGPSSVVIDPAGRSAFVFNTLASSISVVDIARRSVVGTIPTDSAPLRGQFNARGDRLFVVHERSPYLAVIDPQRLTSITRARVRSGISAVKMDTRRDLLYVGGPDDTMVEVYNATALLPVDALKTRDGVSYLTIDAEADTLYMVSAGTASLLVGDLGSRRVVAEIDVGERPSRVAVMGEK